MRVLPILFNTDMVRAILKDKKTVTRRVIKPQPEMELAYIMAGHQCGKWSYSPYVLPDYDKHKGFPKYWTPPCHTGDILYVRETWRKWTGGYSYKADAPDWACQWRPSIHMPKEAARLFLRVTNVQVERLQDITEAGAVYEGCMTRGHFRNLWGSTIKFDDLPRYGWAANPWVWVIAFERCEKPEGYEVNKQ